MVAVPSVRVGAPVTHDTLTVFPLYLEAPAAQLALHQRLVVRVVLHQQDAQGRRHPCTPGCGTRLSTSQ